MKRDYSTLIFIVLFVAIVLWAILSDIAEEHPLGIGLGIGIPVAIFITVLIVFKSARERVLEGVKSLARYLWDALTSASAEQKLRRSERSYIRRDLRDYVAKRANGKCENPNCQFTRQLEYHHIDKNNQNNRRTNLALLCVRCHRDAHAGAAGYRQEQIRLWINRNYQRMKAKP